MSPALAYLYLLNAVDSNPEVPCAMSDQAQGEAKGQATGPPSATPSGRPGDITSCAGDQAEQKLGATAARQDQ